MNKLTLTHNDGFHFQLPLILGIKNYNGPLYHTQHDLPHPGALINTSWLGLVSSIENFFETYEKYRSAVKTCEDPTKYVPKNSNDPSLARVISEYKNILYVSTEFIENIERNLKISLLPEVKYPDWKPIILNRWREHPTIICNKIKHNHNLLVAVEADYKYGSVNGYALCHYVNEAVVTNTKVHPKQKPFSFGSDLRRILAHIYLISFAIFTEMERIFSMELKEDKLASQQKDIDFLKRVSEFMPLNFHHQESIDTPVFYFDGETLSISDGGGPVMPMSAGQIRTIHSGDGYTKTFRFF